MTSGQLVSIKHGHKSWCWINRNNFYFFVIHKQNVLTHFNKISKIKKDDAKAFQDSSKFFRLWSWVRFLATTIFTSHVPVFKYKGIFPIWHRSFCYDTSMVSIYGLLPTFEGAHQHLQLLFKSEQFWFQKCFHSVKLAPCSHSLKSAGFLASGDDQNYRHARHKACNLSVAYNSSISKTKFNSGVLLKLINN